MHPGASKTPNRLVKEKELEKERSIVYTLTLRGYTQRSIADQLHINQSTVSRHLAVMRERNSELFKEQMDPDKKMKNEVIAARDRVMDVVNAKWELLKPLKGKEKTEGLQLAILNGIGVELQRYHDLLGVLPEPEDLWLTSQFKTMKEAMYELSQKEKVKQIETITATSAP